LILIKKKGIFQDNIHPIDKKWGVNQNDAAPVANNLI